jgi:hypothetical protein
MVGAVVASLGMLAASFANRQANNGTTKALLEILNVEFIN